MKKMSSWVEVKYSGVPDEVGEFMDDMQDVEQEINFNNGDLEYKAGRRYIREKLLDAEQDVFKSLKQFNNFIMRGYDEENEEERKKAEKIQSIIKQIEKAKRELESSSGGGRTFRAKVPPAPEVQRYGNLLSKVVRELIFSSLEEIAGQKEDFYHNLFEEVWRWSKIQAYVRTPPAEGEEEEEPEGEIEEMEGMDEKEIVKTFAE